MADSSVPVSSQPLNIDTEQETIAGKDVQRQRVVLVPGRDPRGCSVYHAVSAGGTNQANVKASPGQVYGWRIFNNSNLTDAAHVGYPIYVKLHNNAGTPTPGAGVEETIAVQSGLSEKDFNPMGSAYDTGIGISIVKGIADNDTTPISLDDCVVDLYFA